MRISGFVLVPNPETAAVESGHRAHRSRGAFPAPVDGVYVEPPLFRLGVVPIVSGARCGGRTRSYSMEDDSCNTGLLRVYLRDGPVWPDCRSIEDVCSGHPAAH